MGCRASRPQVEREGGGGVVHQGQPVSNSGEGGGGDAAAFCAAAGLPQYAQSFARAGYDDRVTLASLTALDCDAVRGSLGLGFQTALQRWACRSRRAHRPRDSSSRATPRVFVRGTGSS